ncbi:hypothetical protein HanRHA438_Chr14g0631571 [Helianthus annuus]|nr:hypothetical protein HanIR_Chr14g0672741 [Helianthus annuus]KAJ0851848.1 hypothetical protein HanRHA438_Chr14g0631571 [Helianthus annuus]
MKGKERKEVKATTDHLDNEALICSVGSGVDSLVMDSGASFHATHSSEALRSLNVGDFGKAQLANDEVLYVTCMGDIDLVTLVGST